ncbi:flagellar basal body rod protein FlgF [Polynucleobacter corsicus]|uniref:flagellar basal body rod protein FlgF n=1 Tax=Polynucleobacter corsicus TaxID=2081042 RepID=UPI001BFDA272|nr:flagellar basal body rod protein FlgF [Polynucleobacter corsicus]QWE19330.1 flagellar basal body rod protein FlgF [Polynucleobacter corsicus]
MLDRSAYISMTGAKQSMLQLATTTNNLANAQTPGFREMFAAFRAAPIEGQGASSRAFVVDTTPGTDFTPGPIQTTSNPLDVAIQTRDGFFAVRRPDGSVAYTKNGRFNIDEKGVLRLGDNVVLGQEDAINIPDSIKQISISDDGYISSQMIGVTTFDEAANTPFDEIDQLRLVKINPSTLIRSADGLFDVPGMLQPKADETIRVKQGAVELSNVNPTTAMVQMIEQNRMFDLNMRFIQSADQNAKSANSLMSLSRG